MQDALQHDSFVEANFRGDVGWLGEIGWPPETGSMVSSGVGQVLLLAILGSLSIEAARDSLPESTLARDAPRVPLGRSPGASRVRRSPSSRLPLRAGCAALGLLLNRRVSLGCGTVHQLSSLGEQAVQSLDQEEPAPEPAPGTAPDQPVVRRLEPGSATISWQLPPGLALSAFEGVQPLVCRC